ncbi:putative leucine-rich repeat-containing protein DDB_G0290503 [Uranotaenia lowii]|uniref:putative leucine-rich repeat-containing protein DDB_G0290503 n=1 Tax=Uranotaenia lowii TaxID=190385 RepID=UPI00247A9F1D|nr:putative leucine-rich repeat-containing protein DDB_G0290503 [Uranotaenia lowii]
MNISEKADNLETNQFREKGAPMESDTEDQVSTAGESLSDDFDPDERDTSVDILIDVRRLYVLDKAAVLSEIMRVRIRELRLQNQLEIYQGALEETGAERNRLQLELSQCERMVTIMQQLTADHSNMAEGFTKNYNRAVDVLGQSDLKRIQLMKDCRQTKAQCLEFIKQFEEMKSSYEEESLRSEEESKHNEELQAQVNELVNKNNELRQLLSDAENAQQITSTSYSIKLETMEIEMNKLQQDLEQARSRITHELQSNEALKANADMLLVEKTQISSELTSLENKMVDFEKTMDLKLQEVQQTWQTRYNEDIQKSESDCAALKQAITALQTETLSMTETIEKNREELNNCSNKLETEKSRSNDLESKLSGMQAVLEDRNNEIYALHAKLNGEQKRLEDQRKELQVKVEGMEKEAEQLKKDLEEKDTRIKQLESDSQENVSKAQKELDQKNALYEENLNSLTNAQKQIENLETTVTGLNVKIADLEQQLNSKIENEALIADAPLTVQLTSTPMRPITVDSSPSLASPKNNHAAKDVESSSNYSTFQSSVLRKRESKTFFPRSKADSSKRQPIVFQSLRRFTQNEDLNFSNASTINLDEELLDTGGSSESSVPRVKPFFRRDKQ